MSEELETLPNQNLIDGTPLFTQACIVNDTLRQSMNGVIVDRLFTESPLNSSYIKNLLFNLELEKIQSGSFAKPHFLVGAYAKYLDRTIKDSIRAECPFSDNSAKMFLHGTEAGTYVGFHNVSMVIPALCAKNADKTGYLVVNIMPVVKVQRNHFAKIYMGLIPALRNIRENGNLLPGDYVVACHGFYADPSSIQEAAKATINYCLNSANDSWDTHATSDIEPWSAKKKFSAEAIAAVITSNNGMTSVSFSSKEKLIFADKDSYDNAAARFSSIADKLNYTSSELEAHCSPSTPINPILITIPNA